MNQHRQRALITIAEADEMPLKFLISYKKPDCIIFLHCEQSEQNAARNGSMNHISALLDKARRTCDEHGLVGVNILAIEGPSKHQPLLTISQYFHCLFSSLTSKGFDLILDVTHADKKWLIPLYLAALRQRPCIDSILMVEDGKMLEFWVHVDLTTAERTILEYLLEVHPTTRTPSEITERYVQDHGQGSGSFISKLLRALKEAKLIQEHKEGRHKFIRLSEHGLAVFCPEELRKKIQNQLRVPESRTTTTSTLIPSIQSRLDDYNATSLDEWLSFKRSTYLSLDDYRTALQLGFELHEGLAYYLYQALSGLSASHGDISLESIDEALINTLQAISNQESSRKELNHHPAVTTYLKSRKDKRLTFLERMVDADPRIRQLVTKNQKKE